MHVAVLGLGSIGRRHAANVAAAVPGVRLTIVRHRPVDDQLCRDLGAAVVGSLDQIDGEVDLAIVATPSANHIDTLPALIQRGWPLLVEKPIVTEVADIARIESALRDAPPAVRVAGFNLRYLPSLQRIRRMIARGELGRVVRATFIAGQWLPDWRPHTDYRAGYSADAGRGGGVELDLAHEFDAARWLLGDLHVAYARAGHYSDLELRAHDTAVAMLAPPRGGAPVVTVAVDYVARQRARWYEVVGDRGRVVWNIDGSLELSTADGRRVITDDPAEFDVGATYVSMLRDTLAAIDQGPGDRTQYANRAADGVGGGPQTLADGLASTRLSLEVRDRGTAQEAT